MSFILASQEIISGPEAFVGTKAYSINNPEFIGRINRSLLYL